MDIKNRITQFIKHKGITNAEFERNTTLANGYLTKFKGSIGSDKLKSIVTYYPELNLEWLITGNGSMLKKQTSTEINTPSDIKTSDMQNIYETVVRDKDEQIEKMKAEINQLIGENSIMREQLGIASRKVSNKSA